MEQSLIDKDKLVELMVWRDNQGMISSIDDILDTIENEPTIDPESLRPTAHWVKDGDAENPYRGSGTKYHCSACGRRAGYKQRWLYKFCPCCGAKMEDCA